MTSATNDVELVRTEEQYSLHCQQLSALYKKTVNLTTYTYFMMYFKKQYFCEAYHDLRAAGILRQLLHSAINAAPKSDSSK